MLFDPLTLFMVGAGALAFREMNRKDYAVLTPARDERYRNAMEHCHDPSALLTEAKLFADYGLAAQAALLKRRAEWRGRTDEVKKVHEDTYQKALRSTNVAAILNVAAAFEGWTATKKAAVLRDKARILQQGILQKAAKEAVEAARTAAEAAKATAVTIEPSKPKEERSNGVATTPIPQNEQTAPNVVDDE